MIFLIILSLIFTVTYVFVHQSKFGKAPSGERLRRIESSPNYRDGSFQNISHTPNLTEGVSFFAVMKEFFFTKHPGKKPSVPIPSVKTDLRALDPSANILVWFGHSSYFIQLDGKKILVDPVLSGAASPIRSTTRSFDGADIYKAEDIPEIDYLFISHDHWDHLDYETILKIKFKRVICGLGVGEHFERWGIPDSKIIEKDWNEEFMLDDGFIVSTVSARHFSGRSFTRNKSLWTSFVLQAPSMRIFIGGDSGYDKHFATAGDKFNGFDLVILENGQYDKSWRYIHMMPEEVWRAAKDLKAKKLLAVHSSKFALGNHPWDEPLRRITTSAQEGGVQLITPMIGELVDLKSSTQKFSRWWLPLVK